MDEPPASVYDPTTPVPLSERPPAEPLAIVSWGSAIPTLHLPMPPQALAPIIESIDDDSTPAELTAADAGIVTSSIALPSFFVKNLTSPNLFERYDSLCRSDYC